MTQVKSKANIVQTPLMKQYYSIKDKYPDSIMLFRVGDFYETFSEDAVKISEILGITLTKRANGAAQTVKLAGFPHHALDNYLPRLVRAGQRVAICDQLEDPKTTKKIVKRGVTELVTPGVAINDNILNHNENNFLASLYFGKKSNGIAMLDISTGEFLSAEGDFEYIEKLISGFKPKEILFEKSKKELFYKHFNDNDHSYPLEEWIYNIDTAKDRLLNHFKTASLKGFGIENLSNAIIASGAILHYLDITEHNKISHITTVSRIEEEKYVWLDKFTIRNLELFSTYEGEGSSLSKVIDKTITPMGSRLLKRWIALPLKDVKAIEKRQEVVEQFFKDPNLKESLEQHLEPIGDLERLVSKLATGRVSPREMMQLKIALSNILPIKEQCSNSDNQPLKEQGEKLNSCQELHQRIENELNPDPPALLNKGGVIKEGVSKELDELRTILHSGRDYLKSLQEREIEKTGISSLKISFNNVFGYYIEVRNTHKNKVPENWVRKQTLVSAERYITEELKEYEAKILGAEEKILILENSLYNDLLIYAARYIKTISINAYILAQIDCLLSFASAAECNNYIRPVLNDNLAIEIKSGRHPVIETELPVGESYIPNDIYLNSEDQQIIIITGPNMSGKSALLRQTALITLMAQIGSFVPAECATIGVVDKIFTRVGASDNISKGESTFMVEMNEAASILNNISERSLILFDELGRGTSTYDGISIAWSIVEYIHENGRAPAKTLFATHYHELNEMANTYKRCKNYNVSVKEVEDKVIFLRKLIEGGSNHSFGIHVAKMAGMPKTVVTRAENILKELEETHRKGHLKKPTDSIAQNREGYQLSFFQLDDPVLKQIRDRVADLDINNLTPMDALNELNRIKKIAGLDK
ncbi:DNA mismatch repair protein MutS [Marinilabiliaceae bacterium ANBcel2]|nr:DNA mismatch repair protein MutS [Marinilabiliaceae bacterium ANBcel2]